MKKIKRIAALAGVVILLSLYVLTMVFAVRKDEVARGLFFASLYATVFVPVFLFLIGYVAKLLRSRQDTKSPVVDTVVFDLGKVLIAFPWEDCVKSLHLSEPEERFLREHVYESVYWHNLDLGEMTLEEAIRAVTDTAPQYADAIRGYLSSIYGTLRPFPYTEPWLSSLKKAGYKLYALSNWPVGAIEQMRETGNAGFEAYMDGVLLSCDEKIAKPDPAFFRLLFSRYGLDPSRCVFIDDRQENIDAARDLGMPGFLFTGYEDAQKKLASLGIRP